MDPLLQVPGASRRLTAKPRKPGTTRNRSLFEATAHLPCLDHTLSGLAHGGRLGGSTQSADSVLSHWPIPPCPGYATPSLQSALSFAQQSHPLTEAL